MDQKVKRYYELKKLQKDLDQELAELRKDILDHCAEQNALQLAIGTYEVKVVLQERKEYDDQKLYKVLADPELWRMVSKADSSKIASLVKLNVLSEEGLENTYRIKQVAMLQVNKN